MSDDVASSSSDARARVEDWRRRRHHRDQPGRRLLLRMLDEALELIVELVEIIERLEGHHPNPRRSIIVQVQLNDTQKVQLHAVEENAEGEPIDRDTATCEWTSDRQDVITLDDNADDAFSVFATSVGGGAFGDTTVTATVTEPGVDNGDGTSTPGAVYVGTQVVTVSQDQTISAVEITADAPEPK